jgi:hypothetical protein
LCIEVRRLNTMRDIARPSNVCLFHDDINTYIDQSTAKTIAIYISSHRRAIIKSVQRFVDTSLQGVTSILQWVRGAITDNNRAISKIHTGQRQRLLNTKEIERPVQQSRSRQSTVAEYFTLNQID